MNDFDPVAEALEAMAIVEPELSQHYKTIVRYWCLNPDRVPKARGGTAPWGTRQFIRSKASAFATSRVPKPPAVPRTVPDELVSVILHELFRFPADQLQRIQIEHQSTMAAENMVGDLLERYLASVMEQLGWVWCSGSLVKAVDFIKPPSGSSAQWRQLQVKNRDNSENSSSAAIRQNTDIEKWFRTFSRRKGSNWDSFPDPVVKQNVSEEGFFKFATEYLTDL